MRSDLAWSAGLVPAPLFATVLAFVTLCMVSDLRTRRIPNAITGPAILAGAALNVLYGGHAGLFASLTGLGMGIARSVVDQHGGNMRIDSAPGKGTRVRVHLPVGESTE